MQKCAAQGEQHCLAQRGALLRSSTRAFHIHIEISRHLFRLHPLACLVPIGREFSNDLALIHTQVAEAFYLKILELHLAATHFPERSAKQVAFTCPSSSNCRNQPCYPVLEWEVMNLGYAGTGRTARWITAGVRQLS